MTKNVQCRNGYVNHWEAQPPYIGNYEFSHGLLNNRTWTGNEKLRVYKSRPLQ